LCENTRKWAEDHPRSGPVVLDAQELRQLAEINVPLGVREEPPPQKA
jgi:hypothetical protein